MPLPLGINIASRRSMTTRQIKSFNDLLKSSIRYSFQNMKAAIDYSMTYGRGNPRGLISKFIKMYVNQMTVDMGKMGVKSIEKMFEMAKTKGILPDAQLAFSLTMQVPGILPNITSLPLCQLNFLITLKKVSLCAGSLLISLIKLVNS